MIGNRRKNAFGKNALLIFLSLVFSLAMGMKTVMAQIIYVDQTKQGVSGQSWNDAVSSIAQGIERAVASDCKDIWVAKGTYMEQVQLRPGFHLYGGFAGNESELVDRNFLVSKSIIDAGHAGSAVIGDDGAIIDGFVIRNGNADKGGGIYCELGELSNYTITIKNCTIENNTATSENGAGIYVSNYIPEIRNCVIQNNTAIDGAGGGIYCSCPSGLIKNNEIRGNVASSGGAGIYAHYIGSDFKILNNLITQNYSGHGSGAGLYLGDSLDPTISNNKIVENRGTSSGAGMYLSNSSPWLINNTIACNISEAGAYYDLVCYFAKPRIMNCIIWCNVSYGEAFSSQGYPATQLEVSYSDISIQGGILPAFKNGVGNISQPPVFLDGYFLKAGSSCIDAGNPAHAYDDRNESRNNMGAYGGPNGVLVGVDYYSPSINPKSGFINIEAESSLVTKVKFEGVPGSLAGMLEIQAGGTFIAELSDEDGLAPMWSLEDSEGKLIDKNEVSLKYGDNLLTITAIDGYGNKGKQSIVIKVVDTTAPVVTCPANITVEAIGPDGVPVGNTAIQAFLNGAKVKDSVDIAPVITNDAPATFSIGTTEVTFTAIDKTDNAAICKATVTVVDTTAPAVTCPADIIVEAVGPDGVPAGDGAIETFLNSAQAIDSVDGEVVISNDAPAMFSIGNTKVTFTAKDKAMNTASCTANVSVVDTTAPAIICPANITVEIVGQKGASVSDTEIQAFLAGVKATDIVDSSVSVTNNAPATFIIGDTAVTFTAKDKSNNTVNCMATVTVKMKCCGDVNFDGQLTTADALAILKCYLETGTCNEYLDVNGDGHVSLKDAECVLNRYLERPSCLDDTCGSIGK